jgi:hypothetical protein
MPSRSLTCECITPVGPAQMMSLCYKYHPAHTIELRLRLLLEIVTPFFEHLQRTLLIKSSYIIC